MRLIIILCCLFPLALSAEAFRYVDPNTGEIVFTDKPPANQQADKITIEEPSVASPYKPATPPPSEQATTATPSTQQEVDKEESSAPPVTLSILSPAPDTTIRNNAGLLEVTTALSNAGSLKEFLIRYRLDGEIVSETPSLATTLENVFRGTHTISAEVVLMTGEVLTTAEPHTIYVHQHSISR